MSLTAQNPLCASCFTQRKRPRWRGALGLSCAGSHDLTFLLLSFDLFLETLSLLCSVQDMLLPLVLALAFSSACALSSDCTWLTPSRVWNPLVSPLSWDPGWCILHQEVPNLPCPLPSFALALITYHLLACSTMSRYFLYTWLPATLSSATGTWAPLVRHWCCPIRCTEISTFGAEVRIWVFPQGFTWWKLCPQCGGIKQRWEFGRWGLLECPIIRD